MLGRSTPRRRTMPGGKGLPDEGLLDNVYPLKRLGVNEVLEAEILGRLVARSAAASDLAFQIYCNCNDKEKEKAPSRAQYMRVLRTLARLEGKGYVVRSPFGKQKPFRLTRYGRESIAAVSRDLEPDSLVSLGDVAWCVLSVLAAGMSLMLTSMELPSKLLMVCWLATGLVSGLCAMRLVSIIRRIW
jgi:hypothetical protein